MTYQQKIDLLKKLGFKDLVQELLSNKQNN